MFCLSRILLIMWNSQNEINNYFHSILWDKDWLINSQLLGLRSFVLELFHRLGSSQLWMNFIFASHMIFFVQINWKNFLCFGGCLRLLIMIFFHKLACNGQFCSFLKSLLESWLGIDFQHFSLNFRFLLQDCFCADFLTLPAFFWATSVLLRVWGPI
jgi:hypothetical protein